MTTRNGVLNLAAKHVGYKERRNNITKFWADLKPSFQGQPWCAAFVVWVLKEQGSTLLLNGPSAPYYTPSMEAWARKTGRWKTSAECKPGDVLIFGKGHATHTGFLAAQDGAHVRTIEGNTSSGNGGSQTDGGGVYRRRRPRSWVRGCIDMSSEYSSGASSTSRAALPKTADGKPRTKGPFPLPKGHWYGVDDGSDRSHSGFRAGDRTAIRQIQAVVGTNVDGGFGKGTKEAVKKWQSANGLLADGEVGKDTWAKMGAGK